MKRTESGAFPERQSAQFQRSGGKLGSLPPERGRGAIPYIDWHGSPRQKAGIGTDFSSVWLADIQKVPTVPTRCIQVDSPTHMYLFGRTMLPT